VAANPMSQQAPCAAHVYRITKDKKVFILWHGKQVTTLSGNKAEDFIGDIENMEGKEAQLIMAKVTGHFKHGSEKMNKRN